MMESCNVFLTFESVDEILRCNISNKTSLAVIWPNIAWCYLFFSIYIIKFAVFCWNLTFPLLRVKRLTSLKSSPKLLSCRTSSLVFSPFGKSCYKILNLHQLRQDRYSLKSVIESLRCYLSNKTSLAELFYSTNYFLWNFKSMWIFCHWQLLGSGRVKLLLVDKWC